MSDLETLSAFDYELPEELIAQHPVTPRDASRLLVVDRATQALSAARFSDLANFLRAGDVLVLNNTRVLNARLLGHRLLPEGRGGKIEFLLLEPRASAQQEAAALWEGIMRSTACQVPGLSFEIPTPSGTPLRGELQSVEPATGTVVARFDRDPVAAGAGELPLPQYIQREAGIAGEDLERYQTVYASSLGSAAAPTAGLHFTPGLLDQLQAQGIQREEVTLHVGLGTFRPVKVERLEDHVMHEERYEISADTAQRITEAKRAGRRVVAVGTTSVRVLESAWGPQGLRSGPGRTRLFVRPGHHAWGCVDAMVTNFHLPKSTLLMLVSSFAGVELTRQAYRRAIEEKMRFFSYGDAMLIL